MFGQHPPHQILINLDIENQRDLIGNALVTEAGISSFSRRLLKPNPEKALWDPAWHEFLA